MMRAAPERGPRGPMLIAALMAFVLVLSAGWGGSWACDTGGASDCACPCGSEVPASESVRRDAAQRPSCCASEEPSGALIAAAVGSAFDWAPDARLAVTPRTRVTVVSLGPPRPGVGKAPPPKLPVFLSHQALLL